MGGSLRARRVPCVPLGPRPSAHCHSRVAGALRLHAAKTHSHEAVKEALKSLKPLADTHFRSPGRLSRGSMGGRKVSNGYANQVRAYRELRMMSKAELARKAGLSTLTIDRVEAGRACRLDTKRKILSAFGLKVGDRAQLFGDPIFEAPPREAMVVRLREVERQQ